MEYSLYSFFNSTTINNFYYEKLCQNNKIFSDFFTKFKLINSHLIDYTYNNPHIQQLNKQNWTTSFNCDEESKNKIAQPSPSNTLEIKLPDVIDFDLYNLPQESFLYYSTIYNMKSCYPECSGNGTIFYLDQDQAFMKAQYDMTNYLIKNFNPFHDGKFIVYPKVYQYVTEQDIKFIIINDKLLVSMKQHFSYNFNDSVKNNLLVSTLCKYFKKIGKDCIAGFINSSKTNLFVCTENNKKCRTISCDNEKLTTTKLGIYNLIKFNNNLAYSPKITKETILPQECIFTNNEEEFNKAKENVFNVIKTQNKVLNLYDKYLYTYRILFNTPKEVSLLSEYKNLLESYMENLNQEQIQKVLSNLTDIGMASVTNYFRTEIYEIIKIIEQKINLCALIIVAGAEAISLTLPMEYRHISTDIDTKIIPIFNFNKFTYQHYIIFLIKFRNYFWNTILDEILEIWNKRYVDYIYDLLLKLELTPVFKTLQITFSNPSETNYEKPFKKRYTIIPKSDTIIQDIHLYSIDFEIKTILKPIFIEENNNIIYLPKLDTYEWNLPILDMPIVTPNIINNSSAQYNYTSYKFNWYNNSTTPQFPDSSYSNDLLAAKTDKLINGNANQGRQSNIIEEKKSSDMSDIETNVIQKEMTDFVTNIADTLKFVNREYISHDIQFLIESNTRPQKREKDVKRKQFIDSYAIQNIVNIVNNEHISISKQDYDNINNVSNKNFLKATEIPLNETRVINKSSNTRNTRNNKVTNKVNEIVENKNNDETNNTLYCSMKFNITDNDFYKLSLRFKYTKIGREQMNKLLYDYYTKIENTVTEGSVSKVLYILTPSYVLKKIIMSEKLLELLRKFDIPNVNKLVLNTAKLSENIYDINTTQWKQDNCLQSREMVCDLLSDKRNVYRINLEEIKKIQPTHLWANIFIEYIVQDLENILYEFSKIKTEDEYDVIKNKISFYILGFNLGLEDLKQYGAISGKKVFNISIAEMVMSILSYSYSIIKLTNVSYSSEDDKQSKIKQVNDFYYCLLGFIHFEETFLRLIS